MIVAGLVLEDGGDETQAIAALLHDSVEDGGGPPMRNRIRAEFGIEVAAIVEACSDSLDPEDARPWRERKATYLAHLPDVTDEATLRVALADKVHNARSIVRDWRAEGHVLWERFTTRPSTTSSGTTARFWSSSARGTLDRSSRISVAQWPNSRTSPTPTPRRRAWIDQSAEIAMSSS